MQFKGIALVMVTLAALSASARAAETVHLYLKSNGEDIQGESTQTSLGRANSIECLSFKMGGAMQLVAASGAPSGRRTYEPIVFRKRIDKSSPLLWRALSRNEVIEGSFRFFRQSPDGTTEHFFTIELGSGRISAIRTISPDTVDPATAKQPPYEEVSIVFQTIRWTYVKGGVQHQDTIGGLPASLPTRPAIVRPPKP